MNSKEILLILTLQQIKGIGKRGLKKILLIFNNFEPNNPVDLLERLKDAHEYDKKIRLPDAKEVESAWDKSREILKISKENKIKIISRKSPKYPEYLLKIPDPPVLLHVKGNIDSLSQKNSIAIVGTRNASIYGANAARKLGRRFAKEGFVVVSGLARGIDTQAHKGALDAGGMTVAVLAHGLHTVYPAENKNLADAIIEKNGALVSEYSWGKNVFRSYFVERDRIQSGLSLGVFVVETDVKGGTMHTVKFCGEQNRVLVVLSAEGFVEKPMGNLRLISEGKGSVVFEMGDELELVKRKLEGVQRDLLMN